MAPIPREYAQTLKGFFLRVFTKGVRLLVSAYFSTLKRVFTIPPSSE